jgi:membrane fusion protein, multidrug efflux system
MKHESITRKLKVYIPLAVIIIIVLAGAIYWYRDYSRYITTDDSHVDADNVTVSSRMLGRIAAIYAEEGDAVNEGMLLAVLDSTDLAAQKNQSVALRSQALSVLNQSEIKYRSDEKGIRVLEINLGRAENDLKRAENQMSGGVITLEQYDHIRSAYETAKAQLESSKALLDVSMAQISTARAAVQSAEAQIKVIEAQLRNTMLYSPIDGIVAKRWLLPGDVISPGQSVFTITDNKEKWIVAYLEETKIGDVHKGQDVKFTIDAFPGVKFYGKVFLTGSSTASVFSLIPPSNASGNFTKVTQRIPVRMSIDRTENGEDLSGFNILSGMSSVVKIIR